MQIFQVPTGHLDLNSPDVLGKRNLIRTKHDTGKDDQKKVVLLFFKDLHLLYKTVCK